MSKETDKKLSDLYLARSEGKVIQIPAVSVKDGPCWIKLEEDYTIGAQCRIKPQTVEEAAECWCKSQCPKGWDTLTLNERLTTAFIKGAQWQKDQDNEKTSN